MPRIYVLFAVLLTFSQSTFVGAQKYSENYLHTYRRPFLSNFSVEFGGGGAYYTGDLVNAYSVSRQNHLLNFSFSMGVKCQVTEILSLRTNITYFRLQAEAERMVWFGHSFKSNNLEGDLELVHDILPKPWTEGYLSRINGYVFLGIGAFHFNPRNIQTGKELDPDKGLNYSKIAISYPVGLGINYHFFENTWVGFEIGYRYTNTDFLDNASFTGYSDHSNDGYFIYGFKASLQLYKKRPVGRR